MGLRIIPPPEDKPPPSRQAELELSVERHPSNIPEPVPEVEIVEAELVAAPEPSLSAVVHDTYAPGVPDLAARVLHDALNTEDPLTRLKLTEHIYSHVGVTPAAASLTLAPGIHGAVEVEIELTRRARLRTIAEGWDGQEATLTAWLDQNSPDDY